MTRMTPVVRCIVTVFALMAASAAADAQSLNGQDVTVTLTETLLNTTPTQSFDPISDTVTAGLGGPQIVGNSGTTNLGNPSTGVLQSGESVNLHDLDITAIVKGGGGAYSGSAAGCSGSPGCAYWDLTSSNATFVFSGLSFGTPGTVLTGVDLTTKNIFGAQVTDVTATGFDVVFGN